MDEIAAWMTVSEEQDHALVSAVRLRAEANQAAVYVRLRGLKPDAVYLEEQSGRQYSGAALMHAGIPLPPFTREYEAYQFVFTELKEAGALYEKVQKWCERNTKIAWSSVFMVAPVPEKQHLPRHCSSIF